MGKGEKYWTCGVYDVIQNGLTIRNIVVGMHKDKNHGKNIIELLQINLTEIKCLLFGIVKES